MNQLYTALLELQNLDREIEQAEAEFSKFDPQLAEAQAPLTSLEQEIANNRVRLADLRQQSHKLENAAANKRDRLKTYDAKLEKVRNAREEAAVRTEMDLVRSALDADENEALEVMEQARRTDLLVDEMEKKLVKVRGEVEPRRAELEAARTEAESNLSALKERRATFAGQLDPASARLYDRVRSGKRKSALAPMTADGACGNCFNILPLQEQTVVRRGDSLHRCEACGIILYPAEETA
jgi:uncharacterized protein